MLALILENLLRRGSALLHGLRLLLAIFGSRQRTFLCRGQFRGVDGGGRPHLLHAFVRVEDDLLGDFGPTNLVHSFALLDLHHGLCSFQTLLLLDCYMVWFADHILSALPRDRRSRLGL